MKRAEGRAAATLGGYRSKRLRYAAAFSPVCPGAVALAELTAYIVQAKHLKPRLDWWQCLSSFYQWVTTAAIHEFMVKPVGEVLTVAMTAGRIREFWNLRYGCMIDAVQQGRKF